METTMVVWGHIGIMEKNMETTIVYWGHIGIVEKKMETTVVYIGVIKCPAQLVPRPCSRAKREYHRTCTHLTPQKNR